MKSVALLVLLWGSAAATLPAQEITTLAPVRTILSLGGLGQRKGAVRSSKA